MIRSTCRALAASGLLAALVLIGPVGAAAQPAPSKGDVVPPFEATGVDGKPHKFDFPRGSRTVFLIFLSGCPGCHKMIPEWNRAYARRPEGLRVVGMILDQEPPGFWSTISVAFPVVRGPARRFLRDIHVNRVPLTLRVIEGGVVEDLALGVTDPIRLGELFKP
jgi:hypothetical protein